MITKPDYPIDLIILEDSSQSGWGGGQSVTYATILALQDFKTMLLIDSVPSLLIERTRQHNIPAISIAHTNKINPVIFNALLLTKVLFNLFYLKPKAVYVTTRKNLLPSIVWKALNLRRPLFIHLHVLPRSKFARALDYIGTLVSTSAFCPSIFVYNRYRSSRLFAALGRKFKIFPLPPKSPPVTTDSSVQKSGFTIGYLGKLSDEKGFLIFAQAAEILLKDGSSKFKFVIAGDGPHSKVAGDLASKYRAEIRYLGLVEDTSVFWESISMLFYPSVYLEETIGLSVIEAAERGIPVLCPRRGNLSYLIDNELVFESHLSEVDKMADQIRNIAQSSATGTIKSCKNIRPSTEIFRDSIKQLFAAQI